MGVDFDLAALLRAIFSDRHDKQEESTATPIPTLPPSRGKGFKRGHSPEGEGLKQRQVFWITMFGNATFLFFARCDSRPAVLRAMSR